MFVGIGRTPKKCNIEIEKLNRGISEMLVKKVSHTRWENDNLIFFQHREYLADSEKGETIIVCAPGPRVTFSWHFCFQNNNDIIMWIIRLLCNQSLRNTIYWYYSCIFNLIKNGIKRIVIRLLVLFMIFEPMLARIFFSLHFKLCLTGIKPVGRPAMHARRLFFGRKSSSSKKIQKRTRRKLLIFKDEKWKYRPPI